MSRVTVHTDTQRIVRYLLDHPGSSVMEKPDVAS